MSHQLSSLNCPQAAQRWPYLVMTLCFPCAESGLAQRHAMIRHSHGLIHILAYICFLAIPRNSWLTLAMVANSAGRSNHFRTCGTSSGYSNSPANGDVSTPASMALGSGYTRDLRGGEGALVEGPACDDFLQLDARSNIASSLRGCSRRLSSSLIDLRSSGRPSESTV